MENLIPLINKLQDAFASAGIAGFDLPQIAVIGSQSSGKSSVLENVVGKDFLPRGSGIVTRRPLVLQLNQHEQKDEYGVFLHDPSRKYYDFGQIRKEIAAETDRLTGENKGISNIPINLKIYSPSVINLTLIDLPGITKVPVGDQPPDIELQIRQMISEFIEKDSCLILAVTPANIDIANSDALQMAKQFDPTGDRTIGVLTKLDLMDEGTDALDILTNKIFPLKHGFVGVVNRSQKDIDSNKDVMSALKKEKDWFNMHLVYNSLGTQCGTQFLREKLRKTLIHHIHQYMPSLKSRLSQKISSLEKELAIMNAPFKNLDPTGTNLDFTNNPQRLQNALLNIIRTFGDTVKSLIDGHDGDISSDTFDILGFMTGAPSTNDPFRKSWSGETGQIVELNSSVRIKYIFKDLFPRTLIQIERRLLSSTMDDEIRTIIYNVCGLRAGLFVPDAVFEIMIKKEILRLENPALDCVDSVHTELVRMINMILTGHNSCIRCFPRLQEWMMLETHVILEQCKKPTIEEVKRLIAMEVSYINTSHPDFAGKEGITKFMDQEKQNKPRFEIGKKKGLPKASNKEGFLMKRGGSRKNWKKRWFVLKNGDISFFESNSDKEPKGSFHLLGCQIQDVDTDEIFPEFEKENRSAAPVSDVDEKTKHLAFQIFASDGSIMFRNHQQLCLYAETVEEKNEWIQAVSDAIEWCALELQKNGLDDVKNLAISKKSPPPPPPRASKPISKRSAPTNFNGTLPRLPEKLYSSDIQGNEFISNSNYSSVTETLEASSLISTDEATITLVRLLLHSYFVIIRKHIQDLVPKAIMLMMVTKLKKDLPAILSQKILSDAKAGPSVSDLLQENDKARQERQTKSEMLVLVRKALTVVESDIRSDFP